MAVDFDLSEDQRAIADVFGSFFGNESAIDVVRGAEPLGFDPALWAKLEAMEAPAMAIPSDAGGGGATYADLLVVAEALGVALAPVPLIEHWSASMFAPAMQVGEIATLAVRPAVEGVWRLAPAGAVADIVVGLDGGELVAVRSEPSNSAPANHGSAPIADRVIGGDRTVVGTQADFDGARALWQLLTAGALVGIAQRALDIGVAYVLEREQFGRPIGAYQAVQHGLADLPAMIDGARFLAHKAAWAHGAGLVGAAGTVDIGDGIVEEFATLASMAFLQAADAAALATDKSLHYHGGYGFSTEYDIQLYYRRARAWAHVAGDPADERVRLAGRLLEGTR